jgi:hypothetical protein
MEIRWTQIKSDLGSSLLPPLPPVQTEPKCLILANPNFEQEITEETESGHQMFICGFFLLGDFAPLREL